MKHNSTLRFAFTATLPVMAGYIVLGIGFGVLLQDKGYAWWWATLMSLTIYAGSMQYVAVDLLAGGASLIATALMTVMVNLRHLFYGITMLTKYNKAGKKKPYLIFALTDETYSLVCAPQLPDGIDEHRYYFYASLLNQCYWVIGSTIGAAAGSALSFNSTGIDFSMTALFVVIFVEQWEKSRRHLPALSGIVISIACRLLFGVDSFLIPAMAGITAAMFLEKRWLKPEDEAKTTDEMKMTDKAKTTDEAKMTDEAKKADKVKTTDEVKTMNKGGSGS